MDKSTWRIGTLSSDGATIAKIIATFSVVLTHSYKLFGYLKIDNNSIFFLRGVHAFASCGVPVFFLLSGYFLTYKDNWNWTRNIKKKVKSLIIPYVLFTFIYAIISCVCSLFLPQFFDDFRHFTFYDWVINLFGIPFVEGPHFYGPLWFMRELIIFNLLSFIFVPLVKKVPNYILIPLLIVLFFLPISQFIRYPIVFFVLGMVFGVKKQLPIVDNIPMTVILFLLAFFIPVVFLYDWAWMVSVFLMTCFIVNVSNLIASIDRIKEPARRLIIYSFPVYLLHEYPITSAMRLIALTHLRLSVYIAIFFFAPFLVIVLCVLISYFWRRCFPKCFAFVFGGRS